MFANAIAKAACAAAMTCAPAQPTTAPNPTAAIGALLAGGPASGLAPLLSGGAPKLPNAKAAAASLLGSAPAAGLMQKGAALLSAAPAASAAKAAEPARQPAALGLQPGGFTPIGDIGEFRFDGARSGVHDGAPVRFLDFTLKNTADVTTFPSTIQQVWWQGRQSGDTAQPLRRDATPFGMHGQYVKPGQSIAVTYVIPDREDVDGVTLSYKHAKPVPAKRVLTWDQIPAAGPVAVDTAAKAPAPKAAAAGALSVPAGAASFQTYGPWEFKVDELVRGPDGHIQAVISARNASKTRLPFTITDYDAYLIDENGRTIQRLGNLYRVSPGGLVAALVNAGSHYLEPGDQIRARLLFPNTKRFAPTQLRLKEPVKSQTTNTYPMS